MQEGAPLRKMLAGYDGRVHYAMDLGGTVHELDPHVGHPFSVRATGVLTCVSCGRRVKKFYGQGFCYPCLQSAPEAAECIVRPELCRAHLGEGRDPVWETAHHHTEHVVYLSQTSDIKVGVTRATQIPIRWIDQGAVTALVIARVPYRQLAGLMEVDLRSVLADKTDWRAMLRQVEPDPGRLIEVRDRVRAHVRHDLREYLRPDEEPFVLAYPVLAYPPTVKSVQLAKDNEVSGVLVGIKGQYLVWEDGRVLNVRNHSGFHVELG